MPFEVTCPCGGRLRAQDEWVGRKGRCPKCGNAIVISRPSEPFYGQSAQAEPPTAPTASEMASSTVSCSSCGARLKVPNAVMGKQGVCPKCRQRFTIPVVSSVAGVPVAGEVRASAEPIEGLKRKCHHCQISVVPRNDICPLCYAFIWRR